MIIKIKINSTNLILYKPIVMTENISNKQKILDVPIFYHFPDGLYQNILDFKIYFIVLIFILVVIFLIIIINSEHDIYDGIIIFSLAHFSSIFVQYFNIFNSIIFIRYLFSYSKDELVDIKTSYFYIARFFHLLLFLIFIMVILNFAIQKFYYETDTIYYIFITSIYYLILGIAIYNIITMFLHCYLPFLILNFIGRDLIMRIFLFIYSISVVAFYYIYPSKKLIFKLIELY